MPIGSILARALGLETKRAADDLSRVPTPYTWPVWYDGRPEPTPSGLAGFDRSAYGANAIIFACISRKAESAALPDLEAQEYRDGAWVDVSPDHPLAVLLRKPNPFMTWYELQELLIVYLELDGNVFLYKQRERENGPVTAIYPLRPDRVRVVPKDGRLLGYVYDGEDTGLFEGLTPFLPNEIIHIKYPNPSDPFEGLGRGRPKLAACFANIDLDNASVSFLARFFKNAAVPFGLLKSRHRISEQRAKEIRQSLAEQYVGERNWHRIMILDEDAEYQRLGADLSDLDLGNLVAFNEARICSVLEVPPILVGAKVGLDRSTYSNAEEARRSFWEDTLIPLYRRFEDGWNAGLAPEFGDNLRIRYGFARVPALSETDGQREKRLLESWQGGLRTREEVRRELGMPPDGDGLFVDEMMGFMKARVRVVDGTGEVSQALPFRVQGRPYP